MKSTSLSDGVDASANITKWICELGDWRGEMLAHVRQLIRDADPDIQEEWKWGVPVWSHDGIVCTGETYKQVVKLTFAHGASVKDPKKRGCPRFCVIGISSTAVAYAHRT